MKLRSFHGSIEAAFIDPAQRLADPLALAQSRAITSEHEFYLFFVFAVERLVTCLDLESMISL